MGGGGAGSILKEMEKEPLSAACVSNAACVTGTQNHDSADACTHAALPIFRAHAVGALGRAVYIALARRGELKNIGLYILIKI